MSEFVEECRREWKRLRVPDPIANEMAADLAADLAEAEAEGASAEQVLGSGAFDPRAFAASWAAERGVVGPAPLIRQTPASVAGYEATRRPRRSAAIAATAAIASFATLAIAVALLSHRSSGATRIEMPSPAGVSMPGPGAQLVFPLRQDIRPGVVVPAIGLFVFVLGVSGFVLWLVFWSPWTGPGRPWRRGSPFDDGVGGPG
jgi:hypothetical protein